MRHGNKNNALGRKKAHRDALLSNMACSLIEHKRISTTLAKARALRRYVEPLITKSKEDSMHSRVRCSAYLQNKEATAALFRDVAPKSGYPSRWLHAHHQAGQPHVVMPLRWP
jgi:large subunit ribosomal protein L17